MRRYERFSTLLTSNRPVAHPHFVAPFKKGPQPADLVLK